VEFNTEQVEAIRSINRKTGWEKIGGGGWETGKEFQGKYLGGKGFVEIVILSGGKDQKSWPYTYARSGDRGGIETKRGAGRFQKLRKKSLGRVQLINSKITPCGVKLIAHALNDFGGTSGRTPNTYSRLKGKEGWRRASGRVFSRF